MAVHVSEYPVAYMLQRDIYVFAYLFFGPYSLYKLIGYRILIAVKEPDPLYAIYSAKSVKQLCVVSLEERLRLLDLDEYSCW